MTFASVIIYRSMYDRRRKGTSKWEFLFVRVVKITVQVGRPEDLCDKLDFVSEPCRMN